MIVLHSVHPLPAFMRGASYQIFKKRSGLAGSQFLKGGYWEGGSDFFQEGGGRSFYIKNKLQ